MNDDHHWKASDFTFDAIYRRTMLAPPGRQGCIAIRGGPGVKTETYIPEEEPMETPDESKLLLRVTLAVRVPYGPDKFKEAAKKLHKLADQIAAETSGIPNSSLLNDDLVKMWETEDTSKWRL